MKLSERLSKLIEKVSKLPPNKKAMDVVGLGKELAPLVILAAKLETFSGESDLSEQHELLKSEFEAFKTSQNSEFETLKTKHAAHIAALRKQLDALRKEKAEGEKNDENMPDNQLRVLQLLPIGGLGLTCKQVASFLGISETEAAVHLGKLGSKFAKSSVTSYHATVWNRTAPGSEYVLAKALESGVESGADIPEIEELVLTDLARFNEGADEGFLHSILVGSDPRFTFDQVRKCLVSLKLR